MRDRYRRRRLRALALLLLVVAPFMVGCVRVHASITVSPDDQISGQIVAAAKKSDDADPGPQFDLNVPFSQKIAVQRYDVDGYAGSEAVFSGLSFSELPQLANMSRETNGVDISLRRAGDLVILEGRVDLTNLSDPDADVQFTVAFPGEVTSTNGDRINSDIVEWKLKPGVVSTMSAQARYSDPSTRSFAGAAMWLALAALVVAGGVGTLAWYNRDQSPRLGAPHRSEKVES